MDSSTTTQIAQIIVQCGRPSRSSRTKSFRASFGRTILEMQFEKILLKYGWEKVLNWECLFVHREKDYSYQCMWKVLNKEVDLGEPTSFLDHVYLGCTQRQCELRKDIVDN